MATRAATLLIAGLMIAAMASGPTFAQTPKTAKDCAKLADPKKKDECVRSLPTAGKSGTKPAQPADPTGPGRAKPATPAVPGKGR